MRCFQVPRKVSGCSFIQWWIRTVVTLSATQMTCTLFANSRRGMNKLGTYYDELMRVVIIGGSGHIGSYLTPQLIDAGLSVLCVSRGLKKPYVAHAAWKRVESVV